MAYAVVGESESHAEDREAMFLNDLVHPMASLTLMGRSPAAFGVWTSLQLYSSKDHVSNTPFLKLQPT